MGIFSSKDKQTPRWAGFRKGELSHDPRIVEYQTQTQQVAHMKWVLLGAIIAGTLLMMVSILSPFLLLGLLSLLSPKTSTSTLVSQVLNGPTGQQIASVPRDVLPFATALVGFAGGIIAAIFKTTTPSAEIGGAPHPLPVAVATGPAQVSKKSPVTLDGTKSHATISGNKALSYLWEQKAGDSVTLTDANKAVATFLAPDKPTNLSFSLTVIDSTGAVSTSDTITITVI